MVVLRTNSFGDKHAALAGRSTSDTMAKSVSPLSQLFFVCQSNLFPLIST